MGVQQQGEQESPCSPLMLWSSKMGRSEAREVRAPLAPSPVEI